MSWFIPELEISAQHRRRREQRNQSLPAHATMNQDSIRRRLTEPSITGSVQIKGPQCPAKPTADPKKQRPQSLEDGEIIEGHSAELTSSLNDGREEAPPPTMFADESLQPTTPSIKEISYNIPIPSEPVRSDLERASAHLDHRDMPSSKGDQGRTPKPCPSSAPSKEKPSSQSMAYAKVRADDSSAHRSQRVDSANHNPTHDCSPSSLGAHRGRQDHARPSGYSPYPKNRWNRCQDRYWPPRSEGSRRASRNASAHPLPSADSRTASAEGDEEVRGMLRKEAVLKDVHRAKMERLREKIDTKVQFERTLFDMRRRASNTGRGPSDELLTGAGRLPPGK